MSNNSFVTLEGGEIGRAQVAQAEAAGLPPSIHMNPVLLKPNTDMGSQVVLQGKVLGNYTASAYYALKPDIKRTVAESYGALAETAEAIVMEGAGSCCEVNLREHDIVNFEMALTTQTPVVLVADIDRGGVFAQIIGSMEIMAEAEKQLVTGFIINKFRGDPALFDSGIDYIETRTGKPVFGVVPYYSDIVIDGEDSVALEKSAAHAAFRPDDINVAAIRLPHISNFTDLAALTDDPDICLRWMSQPQDLTPYDLVIVPGSKNTLYDMGWLKEAGWETALKTFAGQRGKMIIGLCGGFQMLGRTIADPHGIEGDRREISGMALLDTETEIDRVKIVRRTEGRDRLFNATVSGYEIHMGKTRIGSGSRPFLDIASGPEGAMNGDGSVCGTYLHGLFDAGSFRERLIQHLAGQNGKTLAAGISRNDYWVAKEYNYDRLAAHFEKHVDVPGILKAMGIKDT